MLTARRTLSALLSLLIAAALSVALLLKHYGVGTPADAVCGPESGCDVVSQSAYASILGVPLAAIGLIFYVSLAGTLALATFAGKAVRTGVARLVLTALGVSLLVDLLLLGIQATQLHAYCVLCIATYLAGGAAFLALIEARRADVTQALGPGEGRLVVAGWLIGSLSAVVSVAVYQTALAARPSSPTAMLGGGAAGADALTRAQEEVARLQATIDDPQKLEKYFSDKALREFEQAAPQMLDLAGVPFKGPAEAPIKIVEFSDFLCPFCRQLAEGFSAWLPQTGGRVSISFKQYPLDTACNTNIQRQVHEGSCWLAMGGLCAAEQNRFWPYHDRVFGRDPKPATRDDALRFATEAGLDAGAFGSCLERPATREKLLAGIAEGFKSGVKGTPAVFINGKPLSRLNDLLTMVAKESARLGLPPLPPPQPPNR
jgi:serine/threonine-protein kinase